jgi:hypothetical protein
MKYRPEMPEQLKHAWQVVGLLVDWDDHVDLTLLHPVDVHYDRKVEIVEVRQRLPRRRAPTSPGAYRPRMPYAGGATACCLDQPTTHRSDHVLPCAETHRSRTRTSDPVIMRRSRRARMRALAPSNPSLLQLGDHRRC